MDSNCLGPQSRLFKFSRGAENVGKAVAEKIRLRILIVDDNVDAAEIMGVLLESLGHDIQTAHDGHCGVQMARLFRPDVVLLDVGLPEMNGYEVARHLRQDPETRNLLLVAVTGYGQPEDLRRSDEAGFDLHVLKPVGMESLQSILARAEQLADVGARLKCGESIRSI